MEQDREHDLLTVLAALDEEMAEWMFDLLSEAACSVAINQEEGGDDRPRGVEGGFELHTEGQAQPAAPLKGQYGGDRSSSPPGQSAAACPAGTIVTVEPRFSPMRPSIC